MKGDVVVPTVEGENDGEETGIFLIRSISGKGLTIKVSGGYVLTVSVDAVLRVIEGTKREARFTKYPAPHSCIVLEP